MLAFGARGHDRAAYLAFVLSRRSALGGYARFKHWLKERRLAKALEELLSPNSRRSSAYGYRN